jgi:hypothetical protein
MRNSSVAPHLMALLSEEAMTIDVRSNTRRDSGRAAAVAQVNEGWTWTVIFTTAMLCWLSLAVLFSLSIG